MRPTAATYILATIVATGALLVVPGLAQPGLSHPGAPATPLPAASDAIYATDQNGFTIYNFYTGYNQGDVYFWAYDPVDTSATVSLIDQNASRDGLTNPVWTVTANFTASSYNYSWQAKVHYLLPLTLANGGWWNLSIHGTNAGVSNFTFYVHTYQVSAATGQAVYLPGHSGVLHYWITSSVNGAPHGNLTSVALQALYWTSSSSWSAIPGVQTSLGSGSSGAVNFTLPPNADTTGTLQFHLWANTSTSGGTYSESGYTGADEGMLAIGSVQVGSCYACSDYFLPNGTAAYVTVQVVAEGSFFSVPLSGAQVHLRYQAGALTVSPTSGGPTNLTSNASGGAAVIFLATSPPFSSTDVDSVHVTVTDAVNPALTPATLNVSFQVQAPVAGQSTMQVQFGSAQYYGGDTISAKWMIGGPNSSSANGWSGSTWVVDELTTNVLYATGTLPAGQSSGTISFTAPLGYSGLIELIVQAYNRTQSLLATNETWITAPSLLLAPSEVYYLPGDQVSVGVTTEGSAFNGATIWETAQTGGGVILSSGPVSGSSFSFKIPSIAAPNRVTITVGAQSASAGLIASNAITLDEGSGYLVTAGVTTLSSYTDGSYQPGQTVQIHYSVQALGAALLPKAFTIYVLPGSVFFANGYGAQSFGSTSSSGTVSYKIPAGTPTGAQQFSVFVEGAVCFFSCGGETQFGLNVNPNPSALAYELPAGSGITVGWVVLLVLVIIVAILTIVALRRRGRPVVMRPSTPATDASGPAGDSKSGGSPWQEGSGPSESRGQAPGLPPKS